MKALPIALALALAPQSAKPPTPPQVPPQPAQPPAPVQPATPPAPALSLPPQPATDPLAECRANCSRTYYFCLQSDDDQTCNPSWTQCRAACARANPD